MSSRVCRSLLLVVSVLGGCRDRPQTTTAAEPATPDVKPEQPAAARTRWAVVLVASDDTLNARAEPDAGAAVIATLPHDARGIEATGKKRDGWAEIVTAGKTAWVNARYLTEDVAPDGLSSDERAKALLAKLRDVLKNGGDLRTVTGPRGLYVHHFAPLVRFEPEQLSTLAASTEKKKWGGPACGDLCLEGSFAEVIGAPLVAVYDSPERELAANRWLKGGNASADVPAGLGNFPFLSIYHPGTAAHDHLDWKSFGVYFEYQAGEPVIVAIAADVWSP